MSKQFAELRQDEIAAVLIGEHVRSEASWMPRFDVYETVEAYIVLADIPGITVEDVAVDYLQGRLHVKGLRRSDFGNADTGCLRRERLFGWFERWFDFKQVVKGSAIETSYYHGVFKISVPKEHIGWSPTPKLSAILVGDPANHIASPKKNVRA